MDDDPTRIMGRSGEPGGSGPAGPGGGRPHGNMRLLVAGLIAVIVGLVIAIVVIASGGDGDASTVTETPPSVEAGGEAAPGDEAGEAETGAPSGGAEAPAEESPTPAEPEAEEEPEAAPEADEGSSGGIPAE